VSDVHAYNKLVGATPGECEGHAAEVHQGLGGAASAAGQQPLAAGGWMPGMAALVAGQQKPNVQWRQGEQWGYDSDGCGGGGGAVDMGRQAGAPVPPTPTYTDAGMLSALSAVAAECPLPWGCFGEGESDDLDELMNLCM
jgi:hypothetical protein